MQCLRYTVLPVNDRNSNNGDSMASNLNFGAHCSCAFKNRGPFEILKAAGKVRLEHACPWYSG